MNLNQLFAMGGYGIYVWPAYAITLIVFALNLLAIFREKRHAKKIIKQYLSELKSQ